MPRRTGAPPPRTGTQRPHAAHRVLHSRHENFESPLNLVRRANFSADQCAVQSLRKACDPNFRNIHDSAVIFCVRNLIPLRDQVSRQVDCLIGSAFSLATSSFCAPTAWISGAFDHRCGLRTTRSLASPRRGSLRVAATANRIIYCKRMKRSRLNRMASTSEYRIRLPKPLFAPAIDAFVDLIGPCFSRDASSAFSESITRCCAIRSIFRWRLQIAAR